MSRPYGSKNKPKVNIAPPQIAQPQTISTTTQENFSNYNFYAESEKFANQFVTTYAKVMETMMSNRLSSVGYYNPIYANNAMKRFNSASGKPTINNVMNWLLNPRQFEKQLQQTSNWLADACEFYTRMLYYVANILNFDYELVPLNPPLTKNKKEIDLYKKQKAKNNEWLRKFRIKEQLSNVMIEVVRSGGQAYYLRHSDYSDYLQGMPDDYIWINGRTDSVGYTYAMNMSFFYQFPSSISSFAPEFYSFYQEFLTDDGKFNNQMNPYKRMPVESSVIFKFDDSRPEMLPPFSGVLKNALEVEDYQDLLKLKAQLQTFQLLYLEIPKDSNGVPTMKAPEAAMYAANAQAQSPSGTGIMTSPMTLEQIKFDNSQNFNNIIGLGAKNFYESSGLSPAVFGDSTKSAVGITNSIHTDYLMFEHMYDQFERFINFQLSMISGKYNFAIRFLRRSNYKIDEDITNAFKLLDHGGQVSRVLSAMGSEPWQHENMLIDNMISGITDLLIVPSTAFTKSSKDNGSGRPTAEDNNNQISDANDQTRSDGGNADKKFSKHECLNCGKQLDDGLFCNDDCKLEWARYTVEELDGEE